MGSIHVDVTVRNPAEPDRAWEGEFLVDTGAYECLVPRKHLEAIGLVPEGTRDCRLADGSPIRFDKAIARVELMGEFAGVTVLFADDENVTPLLGVIALESLALEVDPKRQHLRRLPAVHL